MTIVSSKIVEPAILKLFHFLELAVEVSTKIDEIVSRDYRTEASSVEIQFCRITSLHRAGYGNPMLILVLQYNEEGTEICRCSLWVYKKGDNFLLESKDEGNSTLEQVTSKVVGHITRWLKAI
ncbi:hypothetical protein A2572_02945 [Candidatus Collierbacteria bacterium RIFOXYD1_FULL_40_9]|uniref:Uncharacterized protein n=1 Tax=Candidatus Collierbacteria bacterium RIFOXYD1_FULL_40_9 TaxID=1817731 RepID=A0A1F5FUX0_9BACT|nr:MAG: hypothetical protein A2572_02945 [Candidatus Collierbacteria bacterium RIFOXYD1_FULL_40_9]